MTGLDTARPHLDGFKIVGEVGRGSMGQVYEAESSELGSVAIKVLNLFSENSEMALERFRREVTVGGRIGHPGIPTVYDSGRLPDGRFYLVMELLRGSDLEDWWEEPGHTRAEALDLICEALEPLAAAHQHGVVHRDLKPENLFVEKNGSVRLLDFGVARDPDASQNLRTATGISVGTPVYMSPEQATKPTEVASPADVWSVGIMLYEALSGELPFNGGSPHAVILHACTQEPTPLLDRVPEVHEEVRALVNWCLKKDPKERPADAGALHVALARLLHREEVRATLVGPAAAPSFRLSHSTAPTQLKQVPVALANSSSTLPPSPLSSLDSTGEIESLHPAPSRKLGLFLLVGFAAAALLGVSMARMDADGAAATEGPAESAPEETPTAFATPPEAEPQAPIVPVMVEDSVEEEVSMGEVSEAREPVRRRERVRREVIEPPEPELEVETPEVAVTPEVVVDEPVAMEALVVPPPTPMTVAVRPTPMTVVTMRPRMRPTMRTQPTEMEPERPGFVTF